jgi:hypothetical protein
MAERKQERIRPEKEIDLTLDEIYMLMEWASEYREDPINGRTANNLANRLLSVWKYWYERTGDPGSFTLRLKR